MMERNQHGPEALRQRLTSPVVRGMARPWPCPRPEPRALGQRGAVQVEHPLAACWGWWRGAMFWRVGDDGSAGWDPGRWYLPAPLESVADANFSTATRASTGRRPPGDGGVPPFISGPGLSSKSHLVAIF